MAALSAQVERWAGEGSALQAIDALLLLAQTEQQRGAAAACAHALDRALSLAVPGQALLPFTEPGLALVPAYEQALVRSGGRGAPNLRARFLATVLDHLRRPAPLATARQAQGLSPRELEIARLLVQGLSNKLIGRELALSEGTVKFHLRNLYAKLGAHNRDDVARRLRA
jgi:LuxR family maltose regulon positive regulatory protein